MCFELVVPRSSLLEWSAWYKHSHETEHFTGLGSVGALAPLGGSKEHTTPLANCSQTFTNSVGPPLNEGLGPP